MNDNLNHIEALDCMPFSGNSLSDEVAQKFITSQSNNIFSFFNESRVDNDSKLVEYDFKKRSWVAGRFIGEAFLQHKGMQYKITIKPRFGENILLKMIGDIFNIRIPKSSSEHSKDKDWQHFIKRIFAFVWLQKLGNANLHGLPKTSENRTYQGVVIKGHLSIRDSILPLYAQSQIVSKYRQKTIDPLIANIFFQAFEILKSDFFVGEINIPNSAEKAIQEIQQIGSRAFITHNQYKSIKYKEIYLRWKPLVDFSWDIIQRKRLSIKQKKDKDNFGFFIDMAEIWEQYLRSFLKRNLAKSGWFLKSDKQVAYKGFFFQRELIPDLIFQKGNRIIVWDAKYKQMEGKYWDVDRADFFQIHTYIQLFMKNFEVLAGGLLYPITIEPDKEYSEEKYTSPCLLKDGGFSTSFSIDGIEMRNNSSEDYFENKRKEFIGRFLERIMPNDKKY